MKKLIGRQLRHFHIDAHLGTGGMGAVYRAQDLNLRRAVAVKVMHPHLSEQEQFQRRFMQEARAAAGLDHPSIVNIYHFGEQDDLLFMVMQLIPGGSLAAHIDSLQENEQRAMLGESLFLLAQVARALDYAHRRGLIHRDVKPDNILVQRLDGPERRGEPPLRAVVTDFGLAKLVEGGVETVTGTFMGTLPYMSPEQALGNTLDGRSDIYSLGVILYQLATGRLPFDIATPTDAVRKHMDETPPPALQIRPDLPDSVVSIIDKALAKDPGDRFQSASYMARALREATAGLATSDAVQPAHEKDAVSLLTRFHDADPVEPAHTGQDMPAPEHVDRLIVTRGSTTPRTYAMDSPEVTIGRHEDSDVVLSAAEVSGRHARLEQTAGAWQIVDLDSTNGTFLDGDKILPNVPELWEAGQPLRMGPYFLQWPASTSSKAPGGRSEYAATDVPPQASQVQSASGQLSLIVDPQRVSVDPGTKAEVHVAIQNFGNTVGQFQLSQDGLPAEWVTVPQEPVGLMPGDRADLVVLLHPPRDSSATAGEHPFRLIARELGGDGEKAAAQGMLVIHPFRQFEAAISPAHVSHGDTVQVSVRNQGNDEAQFAVHGQDPAQAIQFGQRQTVTIAAGEETTTALMLRAKEQPRFGRGQTLPFAVEVNDAEGQERALHGQLKVPARLSTGCVILAVVLILVLAISACCASVLSPGDDVQRTPAPPAAEEVEEVPVEEVDEVEEIVPETFRMTIADIFTIRGRGTLVTGRVENGTVRQGDSITITGPNTNVQTTVAAIEESGSVVEEAGAGDDVGLLLSGVAAGEISSGNVVTLTDEN